MSDADLKPSTSTLGKEEDPIAVLGAAESSARVNIALVKYWGKSEAEANTPAVGSLSLTLDEWGSETRLWWVKRSERDQNSSGHHVTINQETRPDAKADRLLNLALTLAAGRGHPWAHPDQVRAVVQSHNSVPTASGLASSASGMAALGIAAWTALGYGADLERLQRGQIDSGVAELIDLVRVGSGSAVRSLLGGLVRLERDGRTMRALSAPNDWSLAIVVAVVDPGPKSVSSREGMERTRVTSPYYQAWVDSHAADLDAGEQAVAQRDLMKLGAVMERSTFKMHASMWAADPPLRYIKGATLEALDVVERLRGQGVNAWATMDAGPHVKVLCDQRDASQVARALSEIPKLSEVVIRSPGRAAEASVIRHALPPMN